MSLHQRQLRFLLTKIYKSTGTFKYREAPYNLKRGPVLFILPARSAMNGTNSVHFLGSLIWRKLTNLVKSSRSISEFKNVIKKIGNIDCGCMICNTLWANFDVVLVLCILYEHAVTSHLTLYSIQLTGCYMICKNAENVEYLGYWRRLYHFVCHFSFYIIWEFCNFR